MKGIYKISIYIIIPSPLSFLDLDPNTALRRQADLWGLGSKMLEMRGRYDVAYYSPYLSFLWAKRAEIIQNTRTMYIRVHVYHIVPICDLTSQ